MEFQSFLDIHATIDPSIRVDMFITLQRLYDAGKGSIKMFITLERFSNAGEDNVVLEKCDTTAEAVPRIPSPRNFLPKYTEKAENPITTIHSIHC